MSFTNLAYCTKFFILRTWCETEQMAKDSDSDGEVELLYEQDEHVSKAILKGFEPGCCICINTNLDKKI